jgi:hypothetical protein
MKRTLLVVFLSVLALPGFCQNGGTEFSHNKRKQEEGKNSLFGLYLGGGCATSNNYDIAPSAGIEFVKGMGQRTGLGFNLFYQGYSLYYDNEKNSAKHGTGIAGAILRHASSYVFVAPRVEYGIGRKQKIHFYANVGVGFKISGFDSLRKWDHSYNNPSVNNYDSSLDMSKNMNSMLMRVGVGFKEYFNLGKHWRFTLTQDFGFLPMGLTKTGDPYNASRTYYTPQKLNPGYISLQLGIMHTKYE